MIDGLSIITGVSLTVFLMFYLAFNIDKEHVFLKILTVFAGLFILVLIPTTTINLNHDCAILSNGTYICFNQSGSQIDPPTNTVSNSFLNSVLWYIRIFAAYIFVFYSWKALGYFKFVAKSKYKWRKI